MQRTLPMVTSRARSKRAVLSGVGLALSLAGCSGEVVKPYDPITDPTQLYLQLRVNYGAVNLSLTPGYDTFQLTATPFNGLGQPMTGLPDPIFSSSDTTTVKVSPSGLLTALKAGTNIMVTATLTTSDNMIQADTVMVNVKATTDPPPVLATLTIHPVAPDSAIVPIVRPGSKGDIFISLWYNATYGAAVRLTKFLKESTADGTAITALQTEYLSLDPTVATVNRRNGAIAALSVGQARLVARTVVYGVAKADTAVFTVTAPVAQGVVLNGSTEGTGSIYRPSIVTVRQNGVVYWADALRPIGVVFDGPAAPSIPAASICATPIASAPTACDADFSPDTSSTNRYRIRQFPIPGTYTYRDTLSGAAGTVIVTDSVAAGP